VAVIHHVVVIDEVNDDVIVPLLLRDGTTEDEDDCDNDAEGEMDRITVAVGFSLSVGERVFERTCVVDIDLATL